ncbi:hypothetical protein ACIPYQ_25275 [Streptomyces sp. NPDC090045]|uniref:hypothetical protein n=1 Tax=Streptomyces sp. NPDC090045 TaxID=3365927 RepID=UPI0037F7B050
MAGFEEAALERVRMARARLQAAREAGDAFEEAQAAEELEDALRVAHDHGVATDAGARHGLHSLTRSSRSAVQLYEITYLGTGPEPDVRMVAAREVAAVIEHADEHGMQILIRPGPRPLREPDTREEDA